MNDFVLDADAGVATVVDVTAHLAGGAYAVWVAAREMRNFVNIVLAGSTAADAADVPFNVPLVLFACLTDVVWNSAAREAGGNTALVAEKVIFGSTFHLLWSKFAAFVARFHLAWADRFESKPVGAEATFDKIAELFNRHLLSNRIIQIRMQLRTLSCIEYL